MTDVDLVLVQSRAPGLFWTTPPTTHVAEEGDSMHKRDLKSLYSWAQSIASSSSEKRPCKRAKEEAAASSQQDVAPQHPTSAPETEQQQHEEEDWNIPSDTTIALKMMHAQFPEIEKVSVAPFVLLSQLYSSVRDRTLVDRELEVMKQQMAIRVFKLSTGQDDYAIMFLNDYLEQVKAAKKRLEGKHTQRDVVVFDWFMNHVLLTHVDVGITQVNLESLLSKAGHVQDNHISLLIKAGLLVRQLADDKSYWFAIPNVGFLLKSLAQGRREILSLLNRRQYKEMLLSALEKKKLRMSQLGMRFHIRDLLGSGHLCLSHTATGLLVRISKD